MTQEYPSTVDHVLAPPLVPRNLADILHDSDALLGLIANQPLPTVAEVALSLMYAANAAGASEIAEAANTVSRIASGQKTVVLVGAIRDLSAAIARARREHYLGS